MHFENGTVDSIRSTSQRALAAYWARLALTRQGLPPFDQFAPGPGVHDPKHLAVWKVEAGGGQLEFRALYRGSFIDEAVDDPWVGKTLTEVAPPTLRAPIIEASAHCASTGCAIYTVLRTYAGAGSPLDLERLLLPFGTRTRGPSDALTQACAAILLEPSVARDRLTVDIYHPADDSGVARLEHGEQSSAEAEEHHRPAEREVVAGELNWREQAQGDRGGHRDSSEPSREAGAGEEGQAPEEVPVVHDRAQQDRGGHHRGGGQHHVGR